MKTRTTSLRAPVAGRTPDIATPKPAADRDEKAPPPASRRDAQESSKRLLGAAFLSGPFRSRRGKPVVRDTNAARIAEFLLRRSIFLQAVVLCRLATAI
jgi:hypothetical protein